MLKLKQTLLAAIFSGVGLLSVSTLANAATPGFYLGGGAGWGDTHYNADFSKINSSVEEDGVVPASTSKKDTGLAGRIFTGYQFNQNWAVELGYTRFSQSYLKYAFDNANKFKLSVKQEAVDLVGKGIIPLQDGFSVYGKAGMAWLKSDLDMSATVFGEHASRHIDDEKKLLPTVGAGISYDLTKNVPLSLGWDHIQSVGDTQLRNTDMVSLSLAYNFD